MLNQATINILNNLKCSIFGKRQRISAQKFYMQTVHFNATSLYIQNKLVPQIAILQTDIRQAMLLERLAITGKNP